MPRKKLPTRKKVSRKAARRSGEGSTTNPLAFAMPEILNTFVRPVITSLLNTGVPSVTKLHKAFRDGTGSCVSDTQFRLWLRDLGISVNRTLAVGGVPQEGQAKPPIFHQPEGSPRPTISMPESPSPNDVFDNAPVGGPALGATIKVNSKGTLVTQSPHGVVGGFVTDETPALAGAQSE